MEVLISGLMVGKHSAGCGQEQFPAKASLFPDVSFASFELVSCWLSESFADVFAGVWVPNAPLHRFELPAK